MLGFDEYMLWMGRNTPDRYWNPRYCRNGEFVQGRPEQYGPDLTHEFLVDFMRRHRERPFFVYYSAVLAHTPFMRTPDTKPSTKGHAHRSSSTWCITSTSRWAGSSRTSTSSACATTRSSCSPRTMAPMASRSAPFAASPSVGIKGDVAEGGVREPLIVNCPALVPAGRVCPDLTDFTDIFPTVLELAGVPPPPNLKLDGRSIAPQILGRPGNPREWVYAQLAGDYFIADHRFKLYGNGKLVDISDSPAAEKPVSETDEAAMKARQRLAAALGESAGWRGGVCSGQDGAPSRSPPPTEARRREGYRADLQLLVERKIIDSADAWIGKPNLDGQQVAAMIVKAASQFTPATTTDQAIAILQREGIINSAGYWKEHAAAGQTCNAASVTRLIQKLTERLRSR